MTTLAHSYSTTSLRLAERTQFSLAAGDVLVVSTDSNGAANAVRLSDRAGSIVQNAWVLAASATQTIGPYATHAQIEVHCITPAVTVEIGVPESVSLPSGGDAGDVLTKSSASDFAVAWAAWKPAQYTTEERDALDPLPDEGVVIYNTTTHKLNLMTDGGWEEVTSTVEGT